MTHNARMSGWLVLFLLLLTTTFQAGAHPAHADVVKTFTLSHVTFADGSTAEGTITYDFTTNAFVSVNISAGGAVYDNSAAAPVSISTGSFYGAYDSPVASDTFEFILNTPLTPTSGSAITLDPNQSTETIDTTPSGDGGTVTTLAIVSGSVLPISALPKTIASLSGPAGKNGWFTGPVTVTLKAAAGSLPVASTEYSVDGGAALAYSGPFVVSPEAAHTVNFRSMDTGGNQEAIEAAAVDIDGTPPVTSGSSADGVTFNYAATDAVSGVAATDYTLDGGAVKTASGGAIVTTGYGAHALSLWSVDVAGNQETPQAITVVTPPSRPGTPTLAGRTGTTVTLTWTASQDTLGVAGYQLFRYHPGHSGRGGGGGRWFMTATTTTNRIVYPLNGAADFYVQGVDATGHASLASGSAILQGDVKPTIYPVDGIQSDRVCAILGGGFGQLVGIGPTSLSPYAMTSSGFPGPALTVVGGPPGMTVNRLTGLISWTPTGPPGTYSATITATNPAGTASSTFPYTVFAAGTDILSPSTPALAPTFSNITHTSATVSWQASTDNVGVAGYEIDVYTGGNPLVVKQAGTKLSATVTGLPPGSTGYVRIYAYDAAGNYSDGSPYGTVTLLP